MEEKILNTINAINNSRCCKGCGGLVISGKCSWCGKQYEGVLNLTKELENLLSHERVSFKIFSELLSIKDIPFVSKIINDNKNYYTNYLKEKYDKGEYDEVIEFLTKENANFIINTNSVFKNLAKEFYLNGAKNVSDDAYLKFLELFIDKILDVSNFRDLNNRKPHVKFVSNGEMKRIINDRKNAEPTRGVCIQGALGLYFIKFNREAFLKSKKEPLTKNMKTVYHELQHSIQENYYKNPNRYCLVGLLIAKDLVLENIFKNYYKENYDILPVEANANYFADSAVIDDLKALNIYNGELDKELSELKILNLNPYRIFKKKQTNINDLFDSIDIPSEVLNLYPVLSLEYKALGPSLIKRSKEEIIDLLNATNNPEIITILNYILQTFEEKKEFNI